MSTLSPKTITTIKSTVPLLKEHVSDITLTMYDIMFEKYPEVKELFSNASAKQPQILATVVFAYAVNIDNLELLSDAIGRMSAKHVVSHVKPEHYPIVGESLLAAMSEVLGDEATPEILEAWGEAYFFLADILIEKEKELYANVKQVS